MNDPISRAMRARDAAHLKRNGAPMAARLLGERVVVELPSGDLEVVRSHDEARRLMAATWDARAARWAAEDRRAARFYIAGGAAMVLVLSALVLGVIGLLEGWWG